MAFMFLHLPYCDSFGVVFDECPRLSQTILGVLLLRKLSK